jgi:hypothetical protein
MVLFTPAGALAQPLDHLLPGNVPIGYQPEEFVASLPGVNGGIKGWRVFDIMYRVLYTYYAVSRGS